VVLGVLGSEGVVVNQLLDKVSTALVELSLGLLPCEFVAVRLALIFAFGL
jgi:hypothetical protein